MTSLLTVILLMLGGLACLTVLTAIVTWLERPKSPARDAWLVPSFRVVEPIYDWAEEEDFDPKHDTRAEASPEGR